MTESRTRKTEAFFAGTASLVIRFRVPVLILVLILTALAVTQVRNLGIDTSNEGFFHEDDPILHTYYQFRDQFGRDDKIAVAVRSNNIFSLEFLHKLKALHEDLEENVPYLNDITSMVNVRNTYGDGDTLRVDDLLADFPESEQDLAVLKTRVMSSPLYQNQVISADGTMTAVVIEYDVYTSDGEDDLLAGFDFEEDSETPLEYLSDEEVSEIVARVEEIASLHDGEDFQTYTAGSTVVTQTLKKFMMSDMQQFLRLAVLTIAVCLFVMFRRASGVVLPLFVVALTLVTTLGVMAAAGFQFKTPTTILPSFLLAVGVGDSVHILALTYLNLRRGAARNEAIIGAFSHAGLALVMTTLTTAVGLASFAAAKIAPIADLGLFSAIGVLIALFYTFTFLPAMLSLIPLKTKDEPAEEVKHATAMDRLMDGVAAFSVRRYRGMLITSVLVIGCGIGGLLKVSFSHDVLTWLPETLPVRQAMEVVNEDLRGSVVLEMILDTGVENGLYDRETLVSIDKLAAELERDYRDDDLFVGKVVSITTILKEIHQALHENDPAYYKIPDNARLIPQELLLFENSGSDDLQDVIDSQFRVARITLKVPWLDALEYLPFIQDVEARFEQEFGGRQLEGGQPIQVTTTGIMALLGSIVHATIYSAAQSYGIAFLLITLMMVAMIGELRMGLIAMLPNLGPILLVLGMIGWLGVPLNMFTMLVASIAIGLSVDNTIHFMSNFRKYYEETGSIQAGLENALHTTGRALLTTTVVLSIGFFSFMFSSMNNLFEFGLYTGITIVLALVSNFFMAPALLRLVLGDSK